MVMRSSVFEDVRRRLQTAEKYIYRDGRVVTSHGVFSSAMELSALQSLIQVGDVAYVVRSDASAATILEQYVCYELVGLGRPFSALCRLGAPRRGRWRIRG